MACHFLQGPMDLLWDWYVGVSCVCPTQPSGSSSLLLSQLHLYCQHLPTWREAQPLAMGSVYFYFTCKLFFLVLSPFLLETREISSKQKAVTLMPVPKTQMGLIKLSKGKAWGSSYFLKEPHQITSPLP